ncbi:hypothetical protein [Micromonospora sp. IBSANI012]|uniref:hypothetical protein n=1 Tax=Micromonospora sp. IBSANI012 TaxID=3457761 RepID=UPI0040589E99
MMRPPRVKVRPTRLGVGLMVLAHPLVEVIKIAAGFTSDPTKGQLALTATTAALVGLLTYATLAEPQKKPDFGSCYVY